MKHILIFFILLLSYSCVPLRIAPNIKDNKVMVAKKFKRQLPKDYAFIFEDPKDADEFYNYINIKYEREHVDVDLQVPLRIDGSTYYMSFYETEIPNKTLNLALIAVDAKREQNGNDPLFQDNHVSRVGKWYIVITMIDSEGNDALHPDYSNKDMVYAALMELKHQYLTTSNYLDARLRKKP